MMTLLDTDSLYDDNFTSISDFIDCVERGGEIDFVWKGIEYGISH